MKFKICFVSSVKMPQSPVAERVHEFDIVRALKLQLLKRVVPVYLKENFKCLSTIHSGELNKNPFETRKWVDIRAASTLQKLVS